MHKLKNFLFGEHSLRQTLAKNSFWLTVTNIGGNLIKMIVVIYAARLLGATEYGLFSYALGVAATFTIFSDLGLSWLIAIHLVQREKTQEAYLLTVMLLRVSFALAVIVLTVAVGPLIVKLPDAKLLIPIAALIMFFEDGRSLLTNFARAENRMDKEAFGYIVANILIVVFSLIGLRYSSTAWMLMLMYLVGNALGVLAMLAPVRKSVKEMFHKFQGFRFSFAIAKDILVVAIPFGLASALSTFMLNTDTLIIGWFRTATDLGYYAAALRPISAFSLIPTILVGSSLPLIARLAKEENRDLLKKLIERLIAVSFAVVLPLAVGGIILASPIIHFLYGKEYAGAIVSFQLLFVTLAITYPSSIVNNLIFSFKKLKIFTLAMIVGALGNAVLDLLFIPPFGIAGSVVATIGTLIIINSYVWHKAKEIQPFAIMPQLSRILVATSLMALCTFVLQLASINFFINIIISAVIYLCVLVVAREPLFKDVRALLHFQ